jgi:putative selenate reductase
VKVAIIGAGPAGLSAAYYLAKLGFSAEVFEAKQDLGGMVSGVIPSFRLTAEAMGADLDRLVELGVQFHLGQALGRDIALADLRKDYPYVFLGVGAQKGKRLGIPGEDAAGVVDALEFLDKVRAGTPMDLGRRVIIIGAGNTAMDAARCSRRLVRDGEVTIVYRRTRAQMPADPAEVVDCLEEGVALRDLLSPAAVIAKAGRVTGLACARMELGERDASGRPRPVPVAGGEEILPADTIIPAISQEPVLDFLAGLQLQRRADGTLVVDPATRETSQEGLFAGGDVVHGPSSIIEAIADGRAVAETIAHRHGIGIEPEPRLEKGISASALLEKKARLWPGLKVPILPLLERSGFKEVLHSFTPETAALEASRCLDCDDLCSLCVTVCPNRSNLAYAMAPFKLEVPLLVQRGGRLQLKSTRTFAVDQTVQTLNIADFCNECGNCTTFCPTAGAPYRDKPRFWIDREGFLEAKDDAFRLERGPAGLVLEARLSGKSHRLEVGPAETRYQSGQITAHLRSGTWKFTGWEVRGNLAEGTEVDLSPCAALIVLLNAESVVPDLAGK